MSGTAYLPITIDAEEGGVDLFQCSCVAEVEYTVEDGQLTDWDVRDFRFDRYETSHWDDTAGEWKRKKVRESWCADDVRPVLLRFLDRARIEEDLMDHLISTGEVCFNNRGRRADYHARVL